MVQTFFRVHRANLFEGIWYKPFLRYMVQTFYGANLMYGTDLMYRLNGINSLRFI